MKKAPTRTCIACGQSGDKRDFVRVVRSPEGAVSLDESGRAAGRGAYVCRKAQCFERACTKRMFDSKLRTKVRPEDYEALERSFKSLCGAVSAGSDVRNGE